MISRKYRIKKNNYRYHRFRKLKLFIISFIAVSGLVVICFESLVMSAVESSIEYNAKSIVSQCVYDNILRVLNDESIDYDNLVKVQKNTDNEISSVDIDTKSINKIKAQIMLSINSKLKKLNEEKYHFSLGTLTGNVVLAGRGPKLALRIEPHGYVNPIITSEFDSTGINQTIHRINLKIDVYFTTVVTFRKKEQSLTTDFLIKETVIVGKIPQYYAEISKKDSD